jgi:LCP family protein required for cell wall assembly
MLAKHSASPRRRGIYHRAVHAARIGEDAPSAAGIQPPRLSQRPKIQRHAPPPHRRIAPWVFVVAALPVLLIAAAGVYAIDLAMHTERAVGNIAQPTLPRGPQIAVSAATAIPRPTNTPNALGTIVPVPTDPPAPTDAPAPTIDPIAAVHFDRKDPFTIMLIGVDAREGDTAPQSDTIILIYIDPSNPGDTVHMLSIPRDLRVTIAGGFGVGKMADVYALGASRHYLESAANPGQGGPALVRDTLEQNFRVQIDYYAQVDFGGFTKIVDAVGGVTVDNPYPIKDDEYPTPDYQFSRVFFPAGILHLYGAQALEFARTRHDDNDYARNARQQQVLLGIRQQALQLNLLAKATDLIDALGSTVKTDFPTQQWLPFAKFGTQLNGASIRQFTLTDLIGDTTIGGIFYTTIDWQQAQQRAREFSPRENKDALAAPASGGVNKGAAIVVENGTETAGIADRWAIALRRQGYTNVTFIDAPVGTKGKVPKSQILYFGSEGATANAVAALLGLSSSSMQDRSSNHPREAPSAAIVVVLGDDAPDPSSA